MIATRNKKLRFNATRNNNQTEVPCNRALGLNDHWERWQEALNWIEAAIDQYFLPIAEIGARFSG